MEPFICSATLKNSCAQHGRMLQLQPLTQAYAIRVAMMHVSDALLHLARNGMHGTTDALKVPTLMQPVGLARLLHWASNCWSNRGVCQQPELKLAHLPASFCVLPHHSAAVERAQPSNQAL